MSELGTGANWCSPEVSGTLVTMELGYVLLPRRVEHLDMFGKMVDSNTAMWR